MTTQTIKDRMLALMRFGAACLSEHREYISDLEGDWLQERAVEVGLLETRKVNEPCSPSCECNRFPTECLFPCSGVSRLLGGDNLINAWHEFCEQRDAALKLADKWEAEAKDTSKSNTVRFTFYGCADELRAIFAPKEGK